MSVKNRAERPETLPKPVVKSPSLTLRVVQVDSSITSKATNSRSLKLGFESFLAVVPFLVIFLAGLFPWLFLPNGATRFAVFENIFLGLTIEALPFLLLGSLLAAALASWGQQRISRLWEATSKNRFKAAATGVGLGLALPMCECGAPSVARQAARDGAPVAMSLVFMLAAPVVNPITILVTWLAFGGEWAIVLGRIGLSLGVALVVGLFLSLNPDTSDFFIPEINQDRDEHRSHLHSHTAGESCHQHGIVETENSQSKFSLFFNKAVGEFIMATKVALPGIALASSFQAYSPHGFLVGLGQGALLSVLILMLLASMMSVCSSVDAFVALSFAGIFPIGSVLAFLVFGPLVNLKSLFLFRLVLRWRAIGLISLFCALLVLLSGVFINLRIN